METSISPNHFFYHTVKAAKAAAATPHLDPFRERRGENKNKTKLENPLIVELCDELLNEPNSTAKKVKESLTARGFVVSKSTIYRIVKDLFYRWTKL